MSLVFNQQGNPCIIFKLNMQYILCKKQEVWIHYVQCALKDAQDIGANGLNMIRKKCKELITEMDDMASH